MAYFKNLKHLFFLLFISTSMAASADTIQLQSTIRDFKISHPDFEGTIGNDPGIVKGVLGPDKKPVYNGNPTTLTTTGVTNFNQWYNNTANVNLSTPYTLTLTNSIAQPNVYSFSSNAFFPIDNQLFGNQNLAHNYHFTLELHSLFNYKGGESITFTGDDDIFLFINDKLVMDLGGVHTAATGTVNLDTLGLTPGNTYSFDLFYAERHTVESVFSMATSIHLNTPEPESYLLLGTFLIAFLFIKKRKSEAQVSNSI